MIMKTVLAIAAHPDDEALGAAGTLARHAAEGDSVHIAFLADGEGSRGSKDNLAHRQGAAQRAGQVIGAQSVTLHDFPDNKMDSVPLLKVAQHVEKIITDINPHIIYTHHIGDLNIDHRITYQAVLTACRPMPESKIEEIYSFEVLSSTEWSGPEDEHPFRPNHYVDISAFYEKKQKALECYAEEMRDFPHSRSYEAVKALATLRGAHVGVQKAESFMVVRTIKR
jgi:LmbE family N-acetylglucosaminyl deacetylase